MIMVHPTPLCRCRVGTIISRLHYILQPTEVTSLLYILSLRRGQISLHKTEMVALLYLMQRPEIRSSSWTTSCRKTQLSSRNQTCSHKTFSIFVSLTNARDHCNISWKVVCWKSQCFHNSINMDIHPSTMLQLMDIWKDCDCCSTMARIPIGRVMKIMRPLSTWQQPIRTKMPSLQFYHTATRCSLKRHSLTLLDSRHNRLL
mmetsp:Transcript_7498/g.28132  ORF Transcript_7498/g.28132 Transcript_7498/m.28132 type:complete len:202 (+) Transcript_7498:1565-2170(+)